MSVIITCNDVNVLRLSNGLFHVFYENMNNLSVLSNLQVSDNVKAMLFNMDQEYFGRGVIDVDIIDYLKNKEDLGVFLDILKSAIAQCKKDGFNDIAMDALWKFHNAIFIYGKRFEH